MSEVFLRQVKLLALQRLRGGEPQPDYPHQHEHDTNIQNNNNSHNTTREPPYTWSRPPVTTLWSQMEQALLLDKQQKQHPPGENSSSSNTNQNNSSFYPPAISPTRDVNSTMQDTLPYLVYRQTICKELAKELGYANIEGDIDSEILDVEDRAKILSMYRQHIAAGPATFFDLWKNENKETILKFGQKQKKNNNNIVKQSEVAELKSQLRDPSLVDVMSQVGAVGFFADLRSLLEGIRCEQSRSSKEDVQAAEELDTSTVSSSSQQQQQQQTKKRSPPSIIFSNLLRRLKNRSGVMMNTDNNNNNKTDDSTTTATKTTAPQDIIIPTLPLNTTDEFLNATLTISDLEQFVKELIPNIRGVRDAPPWLEPYYIAHSVARIAFDADASRRSQSRGITIASVLESAALTDLLQLHEAHAVDATLCFPNEFPVSIGIEHAQLIRLGDDEEEEEQKSPEQEAEEIKHEQSLLRAAIDEAKAASDPDELTLVEASVLYCPDAPSNHHSPTGNNDDDNYVIVTLHLAEQQSIVLRVHRKYTFFPSSREALQKYREEMEMLVAQDESGNRIAAAELEARMMRKKKQEDNDSNSNNTANTVDDVDSHVVLSRTRSVAENWFSLPRMLALYYDFCILDHDHDGVLRHEELRHYRNGALTNLAIDRVFEVFASGDGCIAYTTYLDFIIALEYPHLTASQRYLWKLLDVDHTGNVISVRALMFFAIEICKTLQEHNIITMKAEGLMNELLDMVRLPTDADSVNFEKDVLGSKMGGTVLPLFVDWHSFIKYDSREQQRQAETIDEQQMEEDEDDDVENEGEDEEQEKIVAELAEDEEGDEEEEEEEE